MERVVNYIINHGTKESPVCNHEICMKLNTHEQSVRQHINRARCNGVPICSCNKGYYYSEDKADILETIQSLLKRTIAVEHSVNGLLSRLRTEETK